MALEFKRIRMLCAACGRLSADRIRRCEALRTLKTTYCQASYLEPPHAAIHPMKFIEDVRN